VLLKDGRFTVVIGEKMEISAFCATYCRPQLLEEAIESFLRQDFDGESELVICNDYPEQTLVYDHPRVKIYNIQKTIEKMGDKYDWVIQHTTGKYITPWDDDDIYLPHKLSMSYDIMEGERADYYKLSSCFFYENEEISRLETNNLLFCSGMWRRDVALLDGGCSGAGVNADQVIERKLYKNSKKYIISKEIKDTYFMWRYDNSRPHVSMASGLDPEGRTRNDLRSGAKTGEIELLPKYNRDYETMCAEAVKRFCSGDIEYKFYDISEKP